jgi:hypothetical protein
VKTFNVEDLTHVVLEDFLRLEPTIDVGEASIRDVGDLDAWLRLCCDLTVFTGESVLHGHSLTPVLFFLIDFELSALLPQEYCVVSNMSTSSWWSGGGGEGVECSGGRDYHDWRARGDVGLRGWYSRGSLTVPLQVLHGDGLGSHGGVGRQGLRDGFHRHGVGRVGRLDLGAGFFDLFHFIRCATRRDFGPDAALAGVRLGA